MFTATYNVSWFVWLSAKEMEIKAVPRAVCFEMHFTVLH